MDYEEAKQLRANKFQEQDKEFDALMTSMTLEELYILLGNLIQKRDESMGLSLGECQNALWFDNLIQGIKHFASEKHQKEIMYSEEKCLKAFKMVDLLFTREKRTDVKKLCPVCNAILQEKIALQEQIERVEYKTHLCPESPVHYKKQVAFYIEGQWVLIETKERCKTCGGLLEKRPNGKYVEYFCGKCFEVKFEEVYFNDKWIMAPFCSDCRHNRRLAGQYTDICVKKCECRSEECLKVFQFKNTLRVEESEKEV
jgi:hypothetical protein